MLCLENFVVLIVQPDLLFETFPMTFSFKVCQRFKCGFHQISVFLKAAMIMWACNSEYVVTNVNIKDTIKGLVC